MTEPDKEGIEIFALSDATPPVPTHKAFLAIPGGPESLAIDNRAKVAYANLSKSSTMVIDLAAAKVTLTWPNGCLGSRGLALDAPHQRVFVGCAEGGADLLNAGHKGAIMSRFRFGAGREARPDPRADQGEEARHRPTRHQGRGRARRLRLAGPAGQGGRDHRTQELRRRRGGEDHPRPRGPCAASWRARRATGHALPLARRHGVHYVREECVWWISGAPAPDFPIGSARCWTQRALSVSGVALTGLGSRSRRHVSRARNERRLLGTPRVTACTGPAVEDQLTPASESCTGWRTSSPAAAPIFLSSTRRSPTGTAVAWASGGLVPVRRPRALRRRTL